AASPNPAVAPTPSRRACRSCAAASASPSSPPRSGSSPTARPAPRTWAARSSARCGEMSRVGRNPIRLPKGVDLKTVKPGVVEVKGPKGTLTVNVHPELGLEIEDGVLTVTRKSDAREERAQHGLAR